MTTGDAWGNLEPEEGQNPRLGMYCTSIFSLFIFIQNIVVLVVLMI